MLEQSPDPKARKDWREQADVRDEKGANSSAKLDCNLERPYAPSLLEIIDDAIDNTIDYLQSRLKGRSGPETQPPEQHYKAVRKTSDQRR